MKKYIKRICEKLGWDIHEYENDVELENYSPAGEDFIFTVSKENFEDEVMFYAEDFDADEHAKMWVENMHSVKNVPQSIRTLIDDADAIKEMLLKLANKLSIGRKKYEYNIRRKKN